MHDYDYSILSLSLILSFIPFILIALALSLTPRKNPTPGDPTRTEVNSSTIPSLNDDDQCNQPGDDDNDNPTRTVTEENVNVKEKVKPYDSENCVGADTAVSGDPNPVVESGQGGKKRKKRNGKKKKVNLVVEEEEEEDVRDDEFEISDAELDLLFSPFNNFSSAMQRRIKPQYDEILKCHDSRNLKLSQIINFAMSLVDARSELQQKADVVKRKYVITSALLCKADRSSVDRLRQQIYKLEMEQKRLEEDATVYNWLSEQLKRSPAYRKMLEIGLSMKKEELFGNLGDREDDDVFSDISFEELLAQEKKDSFWQKNGKSRQCSS